MFKVKHSNTWRISLQGTPCSDWLFRHLQSGGPTFLYPFGPLGVIRGWKFHQVHISNVFLHEKLEEQIVVFQPYGFQNPEFPDHVCLLHKSLYDSSNFLVCGSRDWGTSCDLLDSRNHTRIRLFLFLIRKAIWLFICLRGWYSNFKF